MRARLTLILIALTALTALVAASGARAASAPSSGVTGTLSGPSGSALPGMEIEALPAGASACTVASGCVSADTSARGSFTLTGLAAGTTYALQVVDGLQTLTLRSLTAPAAGAAPVSLTLTLPAAAVPAGTSTHRPQRALRWLNAERRRAGVGAGVVLNPRWSQECAAHDAYELANSSLQSTESLTATGYSLGGAWAGLNSDLAEGRWTANASPWQDAPVNLLALLAPSLSVTGIDDGAQRQCAITFPGMLRRPPAHDTVHVVPAPGSHGVPTSELARETPFTPVQFVGLPASQTTGPELFVYLNRAGELGQAPVQITAATLARGGHPVSVRWVDTQTPTLGRYLAGGILIAPHRFAAGATYRATVTVKDGMRTLTRTWSFQTRAAATQSS